MIGNEKLIYLSHSLSEMTPSYGGSQGMTVKPQKQISYGDSCNTEVWTLPNHIGTHVDAPKHFFEEGMGIDIYKPEFWICNNIAIIHCPINRPRWILPKDLSDNIDTNHDCILIKTGFQRYRNDIVYYKDNPGLAPELGQWLRKNYPNVKMIGMDFISVSRFSDRDIGRKAHKEFLCPSRPGNSILPIEDMNLSLITNEMKIKILMIFPVRVKEASGAPVTVIAQMS